MTETNRSENRRAAGRRATASARAAALVAFAVLPLLASAVQAATARSTTTWDGYLDYAYVYSSAEPAALKQRLVQYGRESGLSLEEYLFEAYESLREEGETLDEPATRRLATGYFLLYLANASDRDLDKAVKTINPFDGQQGRHENAYWYHYIHAHRALENGNSRDFVQHNLDLWLDVVVPLESAYETLESLSLSQSPNSGFVAALPYVFENQARLILLRSQEAGMNRDLDALVSIVRLLQDGRVGAYPDVIPPSASSLAYLDRIVERVSGNESDGGSLTFTLALFDAGRYHEHARGLLATKGFGDETIKAIRVASGAYGIALDRAETLQGRAAVYIRVLRQLGEIYAAKQRLGVDPQVDTPFQMEGAIEVYAALFDARDNDEWQAVGFRTTGRDAYVKAMHALWEEIQETHLNGADYYLARSLKEKPRAVELVRSASRLYSRYLSFFQQFATPDAVEFVPESAYFAAYESARGFGDSYMGYTETNPTAAEIDMVVQSYLTGLQIYPFDRRLWSSLTNSLERKGQANDYMNLARPIADAVVRSRDVHKWVQASEPGSKPIGAMRRALGDDLVLMYLGFASAGEGGELEGSLQDLDQKRAALRAELKELESKRQRLTGTSKQDAPPASRGAFDETGDTGRGDRSLVTRRIHNLTDQLAKLEQQLTARKRAMPLYEEARDADPLIDEMRAQRDHPVHRLLRRMYHEKASGASKNEEVSVL
jgi:hypothetical protein